MRRWLYLLPLSLLVGCQPSSIADSTTTGRGEPSNQVASAAIEPEEAQADAAASYKASVASYIKRYVANPASLRQAKIGVPFNGVVHDQKGRVVCAEIHVKNKAGAYSNAKRIAFLLRPDEAVGDSEFDSPICHDQHLVAWTDLNAGETPNRVSSP
jgi:hypothetical protein